ncbi:DHA2 family efflux MFS transporter permease subunit [Streptomyces sp. NPDC026206]|uniref:DHA2 family efflux MFS transporter permease subunit n=1 Tax=Streptomyces sp. NPDC026206 TaxID=3157089 RepID=UPI00340274BB
MLTSLAALMTALDSMVVMTALPAIRLDLNASVEELEWTVNAYTLAFAVLLMAGTALGDRYGRRRVFAMGLVVFTVGSVACALAPGIGWLIAARVAQGVGGAGVMAVAQALLGAAFGPQERPKALGVFGAVTGLATLVGPIVGGVVVQNVAWQWIFWINIPVGMVLLPLILTRLTESTGDARRFDIGGVVLATVAAFGLVWGFVRGNEAGWSSVEVVGGFVMGAAAVAGFVWWELRTPEPLLPIRFFGSRAFSAGNSAMFLLFGCAMSGVFFFAQFLQTALHYDALATGLRLAPWTVAVFIGSPIAGRLVTRFGERPLVVAGLLLQAIASGWIALIATPDMTYVEMVAPFVISGAGIALAVPAVMATVFSSVPPAAVGAASGTSTTMRQLGGVFGIAVSVSVFATVGGYGSAKQFSDGFSAAIATAAALALVGAVAGLVIPKRQTEVVEA